MCLQSASSVIGKGLFDAPPTRLTPQSPEDYRDALRRAVSPEKLAATLARLPTESQKRITDKYLTEPLTRRKFKITRPKKKP